MVGFADLSPLASETRQGLPVGVSIAVALDPGIVSRIEDGPTREYEAEYCRLNALLDELGALCAQVIREAGYTAITTSAAYGDIDRATLSTVLPHKTAATRAGLGWIGKCALLVTGDYGSAVRITTVLTDADLPFGTPVEESDCGACACCVETCPGSAPTGSEWTAGTTRADFFDAFACFRAAKSLSDEQGIGHIICGMCIAACPRTQAYLSARGAAGGPSCS